MIVSILDWRLGCMKYLFMLLIFNYVIIYNVAYKCGYLQIESPVGHVRFQLQQPTMPNPRTGAPCDPTDNICNDNFTPLQKLSYCSQNSNSGSKYPCTYWDANQDVYMTQSAILMTTRVAEYNQSRLCTFGQTQCPKLWENDKPNENGETYLIADEERYTLLLDHTVIAPTSNISASGRQCTGYLKVTRDAIGWQDLCAQKGTLSPEHMIHQIYGGVPAVCYIAPKTTYDSKTHNATGLDVFNVSTMLAVAGIDLEGVSPTNGRSIRYNGAAMVVNIRYQNWQYWLGTGIALYNKYVNTKKYNQAPCEIPYEYELSSVLDTASKREEVLYTSYPSKRVLLNEHGIRLFVLQTGSLAEWSMATLLIAVTSSLTLLAVAGTLVDTLAIYVLPEKKFYAGFKYPETPHVSELVEEQERRSSLDRAAVSALNNIVSNKLLSVYLLSYFIVRIFLFCFHTRLHKARQSTAALAVVPTHLWLLTTLFFFSSF